MRSGEKTRYFNVVYNMDSQLRSMDNRDAFKAQMNSGAAGSMHGGVRPWGGPEEGESSMPTMRCAPGDHRKGFRDHEVRISLDGKKARGKAMWSIPARRAGWRRA